MFSAETPVRNEDQLFVGLGLDRICKRDQSIAAMSEPSRLSGYHWKLLGLLSVATFFEGYDFLALTQILPNLRADMNLERDAAGFLVGFVNIGTILAYLIVRKADQWGRRRVLTVTIAGYTVATFLTGLSPNIWVFAILQLIARVFLLGEWAVSIVIAAEEFPAARRGTVIGVVQAFSSLGSVVCAGLVPMLLTTAYGWRSVYFVGILPLVLLAFARRGLRETERFVERDQSGEQSLWAIWKTPFRKRLLMLALIWATSYVASQNAIAFWKEFAVHERGFSDAQVGTSIVIAALASLPLVFASGWLIDAIGRRRGAVLIFSLGALGVYGSYSLHSYAALTGALVLGIFAASAYLPILNAYTTELFPTEYRGAAFAWANNLIGRLTYVLSPVVVGILAEQVGGFGPVVSVTAVFNVLSIVLIYSLLPETKDLELEDTAALGAGHGLPGPGSAGRDSPRGPRA